MNFALQMDPSVLSTASSSRAEAGADDFLVTQKRSLLDQLSTLTNQAQPQNLTLPGNAIRKIIQQQSHVSSFEERIFDSLVALKVAISQYAMHLDAKERRRLFEELDSKLNVDDWHEEDTLPVPSSFQEFLKWMIHSKHYHWTSIGVSAQGSILVAWHTPRVMLTANFDSRDSVRWTAQVRSASGEVGHSVGTCTLRLFAEQALFYLRKADDNGKVHADH